MAANANVLTSAISVYVNPRIERPALTEFHESPMAQNTEFEAEVRSPCPVSIVSTAQRLAAA
jgi:hypothetical protein